jgi:hypothetical protein
MTDKATYRTKRRAFAPSRRKLSSALTFLLFTVAVSCSGNGPASESDGARDFVRDFYDWYVPASDVFRDRPSELVLEKRPSALDPALARELKEDSDAQAKAPGDIVGLDFDPFLASQDPCERYEVMSVSKKGQSYLVDVHGVGRCEDHQEADLVAEVAARNGNWLFINFHYPRLGAGDLMTILKKLRQDREQSPR